MTKSYNMVDSPVQYYLRCLNPLEANRGEKPRYAIVLVKDAPILHAVASQLMKPSSTLCTNVGSKDNVITTRNRSITRTTRSKRCESGNGHLKIQNVVEKQCTNKERLSILNNSVEESNVRHQNDNLMTKCKSKSLRKPHSLEANRNSKKSNVAGTSANGNVNKKNEVKMKVHEINVRNICGDISARCCTRAGEAMIGRTRLQTVHNKAGLLKNCLRNSKFLLEKAVYNFSKSNLINSKRLILKCIKGRCDCYEEEERIQNKELFKGMVRKESSTKRRILVTHYIKKNKVRSEEYKEPSENIEPKLSSCKKQKRKRFYTACRTKRNVILKRKCIGVSSSSISHLRITDTGLRRKLVNPTLANCVEHNVVLISGSHVAVPESDTLEIQSAEFLTSNPQVDGCNAGANMPQFQLASASRLSEENEKTTGNLVVQSALPIAQAAGNSTATSQNVQLEKLAKSSGNVCTEDSYGTEMTSVVMSPREKTVQQSQKEAVESNRASLVCPVAQTAVQEEVCSARHKHRPSWRYVQKTKMIGEGPLLGGKYRYRILSGVKKAIMPPVCFCCRQQLRTHLELKEHLNAVHPHRCNQCSKACESFLDLEYHRTKVHMKLRHKCSVCNQIFSTGSHYDQHCKSYQHLQNLHCLEQGMQLVLKECFDCDYKSRLPPHFQPRQNKMSKYWQEKELLEDSNSKTLVVHKLPQLQFLRNLIESYNLLDSSFVSKLENMLQEVQQFETSSGPQQGLHSNPDSDASKPKPAIAVIEPTIRALKHPHSRCTRAAFKEASAAPATLKQTQHTNQATSSALTECRNEDDIANQTEHKTITPEKVKHFLNSLDFLDNVDFKSVASNSTPTSSSSSSDATVLCVREAKANDDKQSQVPQDSELFTPLSLPTITRSQNIPDPARTSSVWSIDDDYRFLSSSNYGTTQHRKSLEIFRREFDNMWEQYNNE